MRLDAFYKVAEKYIPAYYIWMNPVTDFASRVEVVRQRLLHLVYEERKQRVPEYYATSSLVSAAYKKRWLNQEKKTREDAITDVNNLISAVLTVENFDERLRALEILERNADRMKVKKRWEGWLILLIPFLIVILIGIIQYF